MADGAERAAEVLLPYHHAVGGVELRPGKVTSAYFTVRRFPKAYRGQPYDGNLNIKSVNATIAYEQGIAYTTFECTFVNGPTKWRTGIFGIPNVHTNAVYELTVKTPRRMTKATVKELEQAKKEFNAAVSAGKTAALAELHGQTNFICLKVGNIQAHDVVTATFKYAGLVEALSPKHFKVGIPACYVPIYGGPQLFGVNLTSTEFTVAFEFGDLKVAQVHVPNADVTTLLAERKVVAKVHGREAKDVFFHVALAEPAAFGGYTVPLIGGSGYATLAVRQPSFSVEEAPLALGLIIDLSGSMFSTAPSNRDLVEVGMFELLRLLRPGVDSIDLITFGSSAHHNITSTVIPADDDAFEGLKAQVQMALSPNLGGTVINKALTLARTGIKPPAGTNRQRVNILLTDGEVEHHEADECFELTKKMLTDDGVLMDIIGIGNGVNAGELARMATGHFFTARKEAEVISIVQHILPLLRQRLDLQPVVGVVTEAGSENVAQYGAWIAAEKASINAFFAPRAPAPMSLDNTSPVITQLPLHEYSVAPPTSIAAVRPQRIFSGSPTVIALITKDAPLEALLASTTSSALPVVIETVTEAHPRAAGIRAVVGHELLTPIVSETVRDRPSYRKAITAHALACGILVPEHTALLAIEEENKDAPMEEDIKTLATAPAPKDTDDDDWDQLAELSLDARVRHGTPPPYAMDFDCDTDGYEGNGGVVQQSAGADSGPSWWDQWSSPITFARPLSGTIGGAAVRRTHAIDQATKVAALRVQNVSIDVAEQVQPRGERLDDAFLKSQRTQLKSNVHLVELSARVHGPNRIGSFFRGAWAKVRLTGSHAQRGRRMPADRRPRPAYARHGRVCIRAHRFWRGLACFFLYGFGGTLRDGLVRCVGACVCCVGPCPCLRGCVPGVLLRGAGWVRVKGRVAVRDHPALNAKLVRSGTQMVRRQSQHPRAADQATTSLRSLRVRVRLG